MPDAPMRVAATLFIWIAFALVMVIAIANAMFIDGGPLVALAIITAVAALGGTRYVWGSVQTAEPSRPAEKAKRRSRLERLLDEMDTDELEQLRARLMAENDGEQVSIEDLIQQARSGRPQ